MKNILIDLGANDGCSIRKFSKILPDFNSLVVYAFEPGSIAESDRMTETLKKFKNVKLFKNPVSSEQKNLIFYEHTKNSSAGTTWFPKANDKKRRGDCGSDISGHVIQKKVTTICLAEFMRGLINESKEEVQFIVKCDIEGEEYNVVPSLLENFLFEKINYFFAEWHEEWNTTSKSGSELEILIKKQNPKIVIDNTWNALGW